MKTLYSIGDSYMTLDDPNDGIIGFCELYSQQKKFKHISLARPGATNFAIRLQIDRAIEQKADYVVVGITCSDRFDVAIDTDHRPKKYTLDHVHYSGYRARSEHHVDHGNCQLVSDTFVNLMQRQYQKALVSDAQLDSLRSYMAYLHNATLSVQRDYYMISDGLRRLQSIGIPFVLIPGWMGHLDWTWVQCVWPAEHPSPYHMPYGPSDWSTPVRFTNTHNPAWAHEEFCQTLLAITPDWH